VGCRRRKTAVFENIREKVTEGGMVKWGKRLEPREEGEKKAYLGRERKL